MVNGIPERNTAKTLCLCLTAPVADDKFVCSVNVAYFLPARPAARPRAGLFFAQAMPTEPAIKRCIAFVDGQNLFHAARNAFGYTYPNFDVRRLADTVCISQGWVLQTARFYTGVPDTSDSPFWHGFWEKKLAAMGRTGVSVFSRPLRYRNKVIRLPNGTEHTYLHGEEKGIDVRIALDIIRLGHQQDYDVALVFSQDQDLSEVATEIRAIAAEQRRWVKIASAFPTSPTARNRRGINKTDWIGIDRAMYDPCIDQRDYRTKREVAPPPN